MKKNISFILIISVFLCIFSSCTESSLKLSDSAQKLLDIVVAETDKWERFDGDYCIMIELRKINNCYYLVCGYDSSPIEHNNNAINRYTPDYSYRYCISDTSLGEPEQDQLSNAYDMLYSSSFIGSIMYYLDDTPEEKQKSLISLFHKIDTKATSDAK